MLEIPAFCSGHLFSALDENQLEIVQSSARKVQLKSGEQLFDVGDEANHFYLVESGKMKLFRLSAAGDEKIIEIIESGKTFAEAVMFMSRREYPVSSAALEASTLWEFKSSSYKLILENSPEACFRMMGIMSMKLHAMLNEIDRISNQESSLRLTGYLLARFKKECTRADHEIKLDIPKKVLASRLSIQPETLSRLLKKLEKNGLICMHDKRIEVTDLKGLEAIMEHGN